MRWKGLSETPSNTKKSLEGLCVGLFVRYPLPRQICLLDAQATGITDSIP